MTESILGFILLCFAVAIVTLGKTGLLIACWGIAALIAIVLALIWLDARAARRDADNAMPRPRVSEAA